jgi:glycerol uptake facilitator-like aquaporin
MISGLQLQENALATCAAPATLVVALQPVSAASNPVITAPERLSGALSSRHAVTLTPAQILGVLVGVVVANLQIAADEENQNAQKHSESAGAGDHQDREQIGEQNVAVSTPTSFRRATA